jgi:hypothetical protein
LQPYIGKGKIRWGMRKWEYIQYLYGEYGGWSLIPTYNGVESQQYKDFNEAGLDGWEFVQYINETGDYPRYLFKREITETVEIKDGVMTLEKFQQELAEYMKGIYGVR